MRWYRESCRSAGCVLSKAAQRHTTSTLGPTAILKSSMMLGIMWQLFLSIDTARKQQIVSGQKAGKKFTGMSMMTDAETAAAADLSAEQRRTASMFLSGSQPAACIGQLSRR